MSGEQLRIGDAKLEHLFCMLELLMKDLGNPLVRTSFLYPKLFKLLNRLGILQSISYNNDMINFAEAVLKNHKNGHIDGKNIYISCI